MMRILFVDDEPRILDGLQRMLRPRRHEWDMHFAAGGEAALERLAAIPFEVVVSDMRMPGMDGAALLAIVRERFPDAIRIVLSGHTELEAALRAVSVAHQFLNKPCEPAALQSVIGRVHALKELLDDQALRRLVGQIDELPHSPRLYQELTQALHDPEVSLAQLASIVEQDIALSVKCLQLVNSAFFGLARTVSSIEQAVNYLGTNTLRALVLSNESFRAFRGAGTRAWFRRDDFERHAVIVARIARRILADRRHADDAFMAGMLHGIGTLVLATRQPAQYETVVETAVGEQRLVNDVERAVFGVSHSEVGAYLLGLWGLPHPIVEAVAYHHAVDRLPTTSLDPTGAVYLACSLAQELDCSSLRDAKRREVDIDYLEAAGLADQLPAWREIATELAAAKGE